MKLAGLLFVDKCLTLREVKSVISSKQIACSTLEAETIFSSKQYSSQEQQSFKETQQPKPQSPNQRIADDTHVKEFNTRLLLI